MVRFLTVAALILAAATSAEAADRWQGPKVQIAFVASPIAESDVGQRVVKPGEPFMVQRLTATASVTLQSDTVIKFWHRTTRFAKGQQLFQATGANGFEVYCGAFDPGGFARSGGSFKHQWACLQDANADGVFDKAYWAPDNPGSFLPIFGEVFAGPEIAAAYRSDAEADRFYFETAIVFSKQAGSQLFFNSKVRRPGDQDWSHGLAMRTVRNSVTLEGVLVGIPANGLPASVDLASTRFQVLAGNAAGVTVKPESAAVGERIMPVYDGY